MGGVMDNPPTEFDWIEWGWDPDSNDLHDSGYRYLTVMGVVGGVKHYLGTAADHIQVYGGVNMDVTAEGVMRIMPNTGKLRVLFPGFMGSDALFATTEPDQDAKLIKVMSRMGRDEL